MSEAAADLPLVPKAEERTGSQAAAAWLRHQVRAVRVWHALGILAGAGAAGSSILEAWVLSSAIGLAAVQQWQAALQLLFWLLLAIALRACFGWAQERAGIDASARVRHRLRLDLYRTMARLDRREEEGAAATITVRLIDQVEALDGFLSRYLILSRLAGLAPLLVLMAVFSQNWVVGLLLLLTGPLIPLFMVLVGWGAEQASRRQSAALAQLGRRFLDRLSGMTTLQLFGRTDQEAQALAVVTEEFRERTMTVLRIAFLSSTVLEFFASVSIALVALYLGSVYLGYFQLGAADGITLQSGLFILLLAPEYFQPLRAYASAYHDRAAALAAAGDLMAVEKAGGIGTVQTVSSSGPVQASASPLPVSLAGIHVRRPGAGSPVLAGLDLEVPAGAFIAVVGPSGIGKSTLLDLLLGFVEPAGGTVQVGGWAPQAARGAISWLPQRSALIAGTVGAVIAQGHPGAPDDAVRMVAAEADVLSFTDTLPLGLGTPVGERGFGLSGGQLRRVALARALLKPAGLLLLDEPTADLDPESEARVLETLRRRAGRQTIVMVTHSVKAASVADQVYHLHEGRLTATGREEVP